MIVNVEAAAVVGVPPIAPLEGTSVRLAGRLPVVTANVTAPAPFCVATVVPYDAPTVPLGKVKVLIDNALLTVTEYVRAAVREAASVGVMVNGNVPAVVGVPVIAPVLVLRTKPVGSGPAPTANDNGATPPLVPIVALYPAPTVPTGRNSVVFVNASKICMVYAWA